MQRNDIEASLLKEPVHTPVAKYTAEFIGAFFLVLTVGCNIHTESICAGLSIGSILMALIFALGSVSGGHFNPAVTLAVLLSGRQKIHVVDAVAYMICQVLGGICAAFLYRSIFSDAFVMEPVGAYSMGQAASCEILLTAALCYVVLNVATAEKQPNTSPNGFFGLAIGFSVVSAAITIGPISGCALNPAVAVGAVFASWAEHGAHEALQHYAKFIFAPFGGALLGVVLFFFVRGGMNDIMEYGEEGNSVSFDANGGSGEMEHQRIPAGYKADLRPCGFYLPGFAFVGWNTAFDGQGKTYGNGASYSMPERDFHVRLFAMWTQVAPSPVPDLPVMSHNKGSRALQRGSSTLFNELYEDHEIVCGLTWTMKRLGTSSDIGVSCLKYSNQGQLQRAISSDSPTDAGISHSGSDVTGLVKGTSGDCEVIKVQVDQIASDSAVLLIVASIFSSGASFTDVKDMSVCVVDTTFERELARYEQPQASRRHNTVVVAAIYRRGSRWAFKAIDEALAVEAAYKTPNPQALSGYVKRHVDECVAEHAAASAWEEWRAQQGRA